MSVSTRRKVEAGHYAFISLATGKTYEAISSYDSFFRVGLWTVYEITPDAQRPQHRLLAKRSAALTSTNLLSQVPAAIEKLEGSK